MLTQITFYQILGLPLIAWGGIFTFLLFILTAYIGWQNSKGVTRPPLITYKMHRILATVGLIVGIFHGLLGLLAFL